MSGLGFIAGGVLKGLGQSLETRVDNQRKERLLELESTLSSARDEQRFGMEQKSNEQQHGFRTQEVQLSDHLAGGRQDRADLSESARQERDIASREKIAAMTKRDNDSDVISYAPDESGEQVGFTRSGKAVKTGIKMSGKDEALLARLERDHSVDTSSTNPDTGETERTRKIDTAAVGTALRRMGRDDLASEYSPSQKRLPGSPLRRNGGGGTAAPVPKLPDGVSAADARAQAKDAIASGKSRSAVLDRLRSMGVDASGL